VPAVAAPVSDASCAEEAAGATGPNVAISHRPSTRPIAAPSNVLITASNVDFAANPTGPHPWAWRKAASVRRPATANTAAAATTAADTPSPAIRTSRSGPSFRAIGGQGMPTTIFVRSGSEIADVWVGPLNADALRELVADHFGLLPDHLPSRNNPSKVS
jgi:hypothetical protein